MWARQPGTRVTAAPVIRPPAESVSRRSMQRGTPHTIIGWPAGWLAGCEWAANQPSLLAVRNAQHLGISKSAFAVHRHCDCLQCAFFQYNGPGKYRYTWCVYKFQDSSTANMTVLHTEGRQFNTARIHFFFFCPLLSESTMRTV